MKLSKPWVLKKHNKVLATDVRQIFEQMTGIEILRAMGYDIGQMEPEQLKRQIHEAYKLHRSDLWKYLQRRELNRKGKGSKEGEQDEVAWLRSVGTRRAKQLFQEAKKMYWVAQQVWKTFPDRRPEDRFYYHDYAVNWSRYDLSEFNIPESKLARYLETRGNLIFALLGQQEEGYYRRDTENLQQEGGVSLGLIIQALDSGREIKGAALARDKQRYFEGVIKGEVQDDLEFALSDWPPEWRKVVPQEEIELYYEYANDYILSEPNGLTQYAQWRASEEWKGWDNLFKDFAKTKPELDLKIILAAQPKEVRDWYKEGADYVGNELMANYFHRLWLTGSAEGGVVNAHDILYWIPYIHNLEPEELRGILSGINTWEENRNFIELLPRYHRDHDPLIDQGPIQSLRELRKRVVAIESNVDLTGIPPKVLDVVLAAPGFDVRALAFLSQRPEFLELVEGKLDEKQPFQPHRRIFTARPLSDVLREALGSYKQGIKGTAIDPKGLFHRLNELVKNRQIHGRQMQVTDLLSAVPYDLEETVIRLLQEQRVNLGPIVEAQVHAKSDPEGWVCGNYTDCCMSFGTPQNTDYMFNRSTQYFTVKYNGRIVAQSVVVDARDQESGQDVIILDNIEVANNYKHLNPLLSLVYQKFWTGYTSRPVKIGTGYSDLIPQTATLQPNNYLPKTPLSYSDARGANIYDLPKITGIEPMDEVITFANLTNERDAELVAKMETESYPKEMCHGEKYIAEILKRQRELEIPGAASSIVVYKGQEPAGYLLMLLEESEVNKGERVAHIYDIAVLPKFRSSAEVLNKMLERMLDVVSSYGLSIEFEARESTTYRLVTNKRMERWLQSKGFYLNRERIKKYPRYLGNEDFYFIRLENRENVEMV